MVRSERVPVLLPARASAENTFAYVIGMLERLADALADPAVEPHHGAEFEAAVCGVIAYLRASGASNEQIAARLVQLLGSAPGVDRAPQETAARMAAVTGWCARADAGLRGAPTA